MVKQGDKILIVPTMPDVLVEKSQLKVGDKIVVFRDEDGNLITHGKTALKEGSQAIISPYQTDDLLINKVAVKGGEDCIKITGAWSRPVPFVGEVVDLGTFDVDYSSSDGQAYISGSCDSLSDIALDDRIEVRANGEMIAVEYWSYYYPYILPKPALNITSLLNEGSNQVNIKVKDVIGVAIGTCALYIRVE